MAADIEARVIQKIATDAEWAESTILPRKGEFMIVGDSSGTPINIKVGNGVDMYPALPYMFDSIQQNVGYVAVTGTALPTPSADVAFSIVGEGAYTFGGNPAFTVPAGHWGIANYSSGAWSFVDMGELPTTPVASIVIEGGEDATSQDAVYQYVKPLYDLTTESSNLSDNVFELGAYNVGTGNNETTANIKRLPRTVITNDMVGLNTISGGGIVPASYARVTVRAAGGGAQALVIPGTGSDEDFNSLTFTITPAMVGLTVGFCIGRIIDEPSEGYENRFMWNKGDVPLPFIPKGQLVIEGKNVEGVAFEYSDEGKVVRTKKVSPKTYTTIEGESGGSGSGYFRYDTGALNVSATRKTILFPVADPLLGYALSGKIDGASLVADAVYFDSSMGYLGYGERVQSGTVILDRKILALPGELPEGTAFIGTGNLNPSAELVLESFEEGEADWDKALFESGLEVSEGSVIKINGYNVFKPSTPVLEDKVVTKIGDSIVRSPVNTVGFVEQIAQKYNMNIIDYSVGGATITYNGNGTNDIVRQVEQAISSDLPTDYIILNGQTNDILASRDVVFGTISDGYDSTLDRETFTGALEWICKNLKTNWPQAKIVYVRVHHMDTRPYDRQETFGERALEVMKKWAIPVADIYKDGQMNTFIPIHRQLFTDDQDGTHPNTLGYSKFYVPIVESLLNSI